MANNMRLSGLISGMDTDSIIKQLVDVRKTKVNKTKKKQISLNTKQETWKELNTKLKNLQSKYVSTMRFSGAFAKRATKVSNSSAVSVITGENAVKGVQNLEVNQLAKTGYLTGAQLGGDGNYTALSTMEDLGMTFDGSGKANFSVQTGNSSVDISVTKDSTISDVLTKLKDAGLNANFDAKNQRFFVSAKESGVANDFSITASDANGQNALKALGLQVNLTQDKASLAQYKEFDKYYVAGADGIDREATANAMSSLINDEVSKRVNSYISEYKNLQNTVNSANDKINEINSKYQEKGISLDTVENYATRISALEEELKAEGLSDEDKEAKNKELSELKEQKADAQTIASRNKAIENAQSRMATIREDIDISDDDPDNATATAKLTGEITDSFVNKADYAHTVLAGYDPNNTTATGATKVSGQDAIITLNGAEFTNATNTFEINGLTLTALNETKEGESVTLTTQDDTDGIYDMVKNFFKEYNSIINEMDKLYNAADPKLEALTSEDKEMMSDKEVEEWEKKLKDASLRRDENLGNVSSAMKSAMSGGITVNGKIMHLSDFGINTPGYFSSGENEKNAYHIDGDPDDSFSAGNADKLKGLISSDPDTVVSFFTQLSQNLYDKMTDMSKSVDGYRSFGSFFDDKRLKTEYNDYNSKIKDMEERLNAYEDSWYKKFSKMEAAMAKMQSNTSAVTALIGG